MADRVNVNALVQCPNSLLCGLLCREASPLKVAPAAVSNTTLTKIEKLLGNLPHNSKSLLVDDDERSS